MDITKIRHRKLPKDHLLSVLGDREFGANTAHEGDVGLIDPRVGEISLLYPRDLKSKPFLLVVPATEEREVLARIATFGNELAPLSQWLRIATPDWARRLTEETVSPRLDELSPAWVGAICGELISRDVMELSETPLNWALATVGFSIARSRALWGDIRSIEKIIDDVNESRRLLGVDAVNVPKYMVNVWINLSKASKNEITNQTRETFVSSIITKCIFDIRHTGAISSDMLISIINAFPNLKGVEVVDSIGPEDRVRFFDNLVDILRQEHAKASGDSYEITCFVIGYVVGRIGSGEANLELLKEIKLDHPSAAMWGAALPALFKPFPWGRAFGGLGRLILRELSAPLHPWDAPPVDIALAELRATINLDVAYKRLPFRTAQRGFATVELLPGVSHLVSLQTATRNPRQGEVQIARQPQRELDLSPPDLRNQQEELWVFLSKMRDMIDGKLHESRAEGRQTGIYTKKAPSTKKKTYKKD